MSGLETFSLDSTFGLDFFFPQLYTSLSFALCLKNEIAETILGKTKRVARLGAMLGIKHLILLIN